MSLLKLNQVIEESSDLKDILKPVDPAELKAAETSMFEIIRQLKSGPNQSKFDTLELYYLADGILWDFKFRGDNKKYRVVMKELKDAKVDPNMKKLAKDATPVGESHVTAPQIKKVITGDFKDKIKLVIKETAPTWKFSINYSVYSGGLTIQITVNNWEDQVEFSEEDLDLGTWDVNNVTDSSKFDKLQDLVTSKIHKVVIPEMPDPTVSVNVEFINSIGDDLYKLDNT